jgi:hypothetical protein
MIITSKNGSIDVQPRPSFHYVNRREGREREVVVRQGKKERKSSNTVKEGHKQQHHMVEL